MRYVLWQYPAGSLQECVGKTALLVSRRAPVIRCFAEDYLIAKLVPPGPHPRDIIFSVPRVLLIKCILLQSLAKLDHPFHVLVLQMAAHQALHMTTLRFCVTGADATNM